MMMRVCFSSASVIEKCMKNNLLKTEALLRRTKREANTINRERERGRERIRKVRIRIE
ncbi:hypothetical protein N9D57_00070 [bacterium]|nr:hypothetical protein [bacterium]|tara:strand:+ start:3264 stop:3437 length:174 start_codon:yes stop_codon:yes gene_type:complete